jgi:predicted hydrolase (HD superfamily)
MKDPTFARGVDRDDVQRGADLLGVDLTEHIAKVIAAMREISGELGLSRREDP